MIRLLTEQLPPYSSNFSTFQRKRPIVATISETSSNRNKHTPERRGSDASFEGFISEDPKALEEALNKSLENARIENRRLRKKRELAELRANNNTLRDSDSPATIVGTTAVSPTVAPVMGAPIKAKTLRPDRMHPYKDNSEEEHLRWFREVEIRFLMSPEYFTTDQAKVVYCMQSLEGDPNTQWYGYYQANKLDGVTFEFFKSFLLDLIADPVNRRLLAYEKFEATRQRQDQKVSVFKAYLEELKAHLHPMPEELRANFFLAKLRPELKNKILSTDNVPKQREEILAIAIMQENTLDRARPDGGGSGGKHSGGSNKDKPLKARISKPNTTSKEGDKPARTQEGEKKDKGKKRKGGDTVPNELKTPGVCWHCQKPGHLKPDCPDKDKPAVTVAAVSVKNESAPSAPPKRSRKNEQ